LEELTERVVEFESETQTDFLLDRPQSPLFLPAKVGVMFAWHLYGVIMTTMRLALCILVYLASLGILGCGNACHVPGCGSPAHNNFTILPNQHAQLTV
jgi:hypothetical protein